MPSSNTSVQPKMKIGRLSKKRNPQPGCVFVFQLHFHLSYEAYETQLYIVYYFFIFNFIYIRYTYAHTHAKGNSKKVAGCGLRFRGMRKSATCNFATRNFATFFEASSRSWANGFALQAKPLKALPNASQSPLPRERGTCEASDSNAMNPMRWRAADNPLSSGWGSSLRFRVYWMVGKAKPVRPCHRDEIGFNLKTDKNG